MKTIKEGTYVKGSVVITSKKVEGFLSYKNGNPIITDKSGAKWLVNSLTTE